MTELEQGAGSRASSLHEKVAEASFDDNANVALVSFVKGAGPAPIDAMGGVVSMVQVNDAGAETFPAASLAVSVSVWVPSASPAKLAFVVQTAAGDPSSVHERVAPASSEESPKVAEVEFDGLRGADRIVATGGVVSTVHADEAGAEKFPIVSVAVTENE